MTMIANITIFRARQVGFSWLIESVTESITSLPRLSSTVLVSSSTGNCKLRFEPQCSGVAPHHPCYAIIAIVIATLLDRMSLWDVTTKYIKTFILPQSNSRHQRKFRRLDYRCHRCPLLPHLHMKVYGSILQSLESPHSQRALWNKALSFPSKPVFPHLFFLPQTGDCWVWNMCINGRRSASLDSAQTWCGPAWLILIFYLLVDLFQKMIPFVFCEFHLWKINKAMFDVKRRNVVLLFVSSIAETCAFYPFLYIAYLPLFPW